MYFCLTAEIKNLKRNLEELIQNNNLVEENLKKLRKKLNKAKDKLKISEKTFQEKKETIEGLEKKLKEKNIERNLMMKDLKQWSSKITKRTSLLTDLRIEKHNLLMECKVLYFK